MDSVDHVAVAKQKLWTERIGGATLRQAASWLMRLGLLGGLVLLGSTLFAHSDPSLALVFGQGACWCAGAVLLLVVRASRDRCFKDVVPTVTFVWVYLAATYVSALGD